MLLVMSSSARYGFRASLGSMAGCLSALLGMMSISAAGLGALLQAFPSVFDALRWAGAAYLLYLGIRSWRAPVPEATSGVARPPATSSRFAVLYRQGLLVSASNPKAILFAVAFLPQFIAPEDPKLPQFAALLFIFAAIEISWYLVYAGGGHRLGRLLHHASVLRAFNRLTGGVFISFVALLAAVRE
jgi:threonine/homoserine/homoserine lactone efflux protein